MTTENLDDLSSVKIEIDTAQYARVEIFGHTKHYGRISEVEQYGMKMLRVDVPVDGDFAKGFVTHFYGGASIFSLTPCDLASVQAANAGRSAPVGQLTYRSPSSYPPGIEDGEATIGGTTATITWTDAVATADVGEDTKEMREIEADPEAECFCGNPSTPHKWKFHD